MQIILFKPLHKAVNYIIYLEILKQNSRGKGVFILCVVIHDVSYRNYFIKMEGCDKLFRNKFKLFIFYDS